MKNTLNKVRSVASKGYTKAAVVAGLALSASPSYAVDVLTYDDVNGTVAFTPENLSAIAIQALVAAIAAGAVVVAIIKGWRYIRRFFG